MSAPGQPGYRGAMEPAAQPLNKPAPAPQEEEEKKHICDPIKDCWFFGFFRAVGSVLCMDRLFPE